MSKQIYPLSSAYIVANDSIPDKIKQSIIDPNDYISQHFKTPYSQFAYIVRHVLYLDLTCKECKVEFQKFKGIGFIGLEHFGAYLLNKYPYRKPYKYLNLCKIKPVLSYEHEYDLYSKYFENFERLCLRVFDFEKPIHKVNKSILLGRFINVCVANKLVRF